MAKILLEMKNITKTFPGVKALDNVNLKVEEGEIHALVGENGAGKSTLMNVLSGIYPYGSYEGDIIYNGEICRFTNIKDSEAKGIVIIHQELALIPYMTIGENMYLGNEKGPAFSINWNETYGEADEYLKTVGLEESSRTLIKDIGVGKQQLVEIAKALAKHAKLLILDEPTASLGEKEIKPFLNFITKIKKSMDISIIFISHKLDEVFQVADRITVFTEGVKVMTVRKDETTKEECIRAMLKNGNVEPIQIKDKPQDCKTILRVGDCTYDGAKHHLNFRVDSGEVVGFYGLVGSGRTECANAIFGISPMESGDVELHGKKVENITTHGMIRKGLIMTPEARAHGMFKTYSLIDNIEILFLNKFSNKFGIVNDKSAYEFSSRVLEANGVRYSSKDQMISQLSGGNIQKIIIGRSIAVENCSLIILDEPTNGLDLGAKHDVYLKARDLAEKHQKGVIFITSEIDELFSVCNRVYVFAFGDIVEEFTRDQFDKQKILEAAFRTSGGNENGE